MTYADYAAMTEEARMRHAAQLLAAVASVQVPFLPDGDDTQIDTSKQGGSIRATRDLPITPALLRRLRQRMAMAGSFPQLSPAVQRRIRRREAIERAEQPQARKRA